jgi:hypothetical protein
MKRGRQREVVSFLSALPVSTSPHTEWSYSKSSIVVRSEMCPPPCNFWVISSGSEVQLVVANSLSPAPHHPAPHRKFESDVPYDIRSNSFCCNGRLCNYAMEGHVDGHRDD